MKKRRFLTVDMHHADERLNYKYVLIDVRHLVVLLYNRLTHGKIQ